MIPLRLELRGFTCFIGTTVVDFEALEVDLFAIAGPTGAGKSTLLDGLTYALYGETARLGGRAASLMSPGVNEMTAQVVFRSGDRTYRVTRYASRKKSGVQSQVRLERLSEDSTWVQLPESEKIREANYRISAVVGLDFDGFTRAVFLPQGEFHEFLRGDAGKRRRLLSRLMGLDTVEKMQTMAGERAREAEAETQAITTRLKEDYSGANPQTLRSLRGERERLVSSVEELTDQQRQLTAEQQELHGLKVIWEEKRRFENLLEGFAKKESEMANASQRCQQALAARTLLPQVQHMGGIKQRLGVAKFELDKSHQDLLVAEEALVLAKRSQAESVQARSREMPEIEKGLMAIAEAGPFAERLIARGGTLDMAKEGVEEYQEAAWEAFQRQEARVDEIIRLRADLEDITAKVSTIKTAIGSLEVVISKQEPHLKKIKNHGIKAREKAREAELAFAAAENANRAANLCAHLKLGDSCPVCGNLVKQIPINEETDSGQLKVTKDKAAQKVEDLLESYRGLKATLEIDRTRLAERTSVMKDLEAEISEKRKTLDSLSETFSSTGIALDGDPKEELRNRRKSLLASLALWVYKRTGGEDPATANSRYISRRDELQFQLDRASETLANSNQDVERNRMSHEMNGRRVSELTDELSSTERQNLAAIKEAGFVSTEAVFEAVLSDENIAELKNRLDSYQGEKEATEIRLMEVEKRRGGRQFEIAQYEEHSQLATGVAIKLSDSQNALGRIERELQDLEERFLKAKDLRKSLTKAQERSDIYRTLSLDLRGDRFQEFLMTRIQARLAKRASHIVRNVTDDRYDLQLVDGEFYVSDAWNPGENRSARTLSGGETFIASLALALALSDTLAGNKTLGALFLDEGFGTLDRITLDAVTAVLENLTREGRMVGVITHVEALTERMPARLLVTKGREGSSVHWDL
tara:strand:- start:6385 stop:9174 length:2790 start_codon:yes stop_codon:yes gene_type:complete